MYTISREYNVPLDLLLRVNPNVDIYNMMPGSAICVPVWRGRDGMTSGMRDYDDTVIPDREDMEMNTIIDVGMPRGMYTDMEPMMDSDMYSSGDRVMTPDMNRMSNADMAADGDTFAYIVRDGDSVEKILSKFGITMDEFSEYNKQEDMLLKAGITVIIPLK